MARAPGPATPECADPEMLAAYYDRSLAEPDRERLEAHVADCARCQAQLAAIARADEATSATHPRPGVSWLRPLIVVPALAAAAALLIVVRTMRTSNDESRARDQVAMAKHEVPLADLAARAPSRASPPVAATVPSAPASNQLAMNEAKPEPPRLTKHRQALGRRDELHERAMPPAKETQLPKSEHEVVASAPSRTASGDLASTGASPASGQPPVSAPAQTGAVSAPAEMGSDQTAAAPSMQVPAPAPYAMSENAAAPRALAGTASLAARGYDASAVGGPPPAGGGASAGAVAGTAIGAGAGIGSATGAIAGSATPNAGPSPEVLAMISPPDRSTGWQVGKNGMIMRRDPDGRTHPQRSGVSTDLTAGAAPSSTVCWIVGRSGTIIRTIDGEHWELLASPTGDNLVAVASDSADHALVTTASGQNFATSDGGTSWHQQLLPARRAHKKKNSTWAAPIPSPCPRRCHRHAG